MKMSLESIFPSIPKKIKNFINCTQLHFRVNGQKFVLARNLCKHRITLQYTYSKLNALLYAVPMNHHQASTKIEMSKMSISIRSIYHEKSVKLTDEIIVDVDDHQRSEES